MNRITPKLLALAITTLIAGCATIPDIPKQGAIPLSSGAKGKSPANGAKTAEVAPNAVERPQATLFKGNDLMVKLPPSSKPVSIQGEAVSLNFERAPLTDVIHAVLGDLLKLNYSIDAPLKGEITLRTNGSIPRDQLLPTLEGILQANGAALVRDKNGLIHLGPIDVMRGTSARITRRGTPTPGVSIVIYPLHYVGAAEMAEILKPLAPAESILRVDTIRNLIVLSGTSNQISAWQDLIDTFDVDIFAGMSVGIFPLEHASVKEAYNAVKLLMGSTEGGRATPLTGIVRVMPIERLNSLLVVTPRAQYIEKISTWIERIDRAPENDYEPQLFVYPVQNGTAKHLAQILTSLFSGMLESRGGVGGSRSSAGIEGSGVAPGLGVTTISSSPSPSGGGSSTSMRSPTSLNTASGSTTNAGGATGTKGSFSILGATSGSSRSASNAEAPAQTQLAAQIRVVADDTNNALIIYAPRRDYLKIESALKQLDQAPTQVLIEASILEVTLNDDLKYGLEWHLENALGSGWRGSSQLSFNSSGNIGITAPGLGYSITNPAGAVRAVLNTLAEKSLVKVISTPSIMVLDNQTATIHVGDQQPIRSTETLTTGGNISTSIQYKDTGVLLSVTPSVNAGGLVNMVIQQSVTDVGQVDSATGQRSFLQREVSSRVAVRSGETVVLGGLIRDNSTQGKSGIPGLMDIPVMGSLFSTTTDDNQRTELLVMLTPRVLSNDQDLRDITQEMRERLLGLKVLTETMSNTQQPSSTEH